ncbi:MAG: TrkH family potassium uptake protein [Mogibacterium sp.]|nr:TrkH family potassium uptake protein [Mogibacterium sp.]
MADNRRYILNIISIALIVTGLSTVPPVIASILFSEKIAAYSMVSAAVACVGAGLLLGTFGGKTITDIRPRIMYMTVLLTWLVLVLSSSFVFYFAVPGISAADAFMESCASWTGTAASSIFSSMLPEGIMLYRSVLNWLGGVGIVLICLSVIRSRRYVGASLAGIEFPGPDFLKDDVGFRSNYRKIFAIYAAFTLAQFILLSAGGMPIYTALLSALSNSSSAGLHHINNSVIISMPAYIKAVLTIFAFLGSSNSLLFVYLFKRQFSEIKNSSELKFRTGRIALSITAVTVLILMANPAEDFLKTLGNSTVQVVSFLSTSGFIATDMRAWPQVCTIIILLQLFIGSAAFSTGGGFKDARLVVAFKSISYTLYRHIHPNSVRTLTFDKKPIKSDRAVSVNLLIALFMLTYLLGALLLSLDLGIYESLCYSQSMLTCTGTCIGASSASDLVENVSSFSKVVMGLLMICGRLEIYPVLMVFFRGFWKSDASV